MERLDVGLVFFAYSVSIQRISAVNRELCAVYYLLKGCMVMNKKCGLIAGRDNLPFEVVREIIRRGDEAVVIGLKGEVRPELSSLVSRYIEIAPGNLGEMMAYFQREQVGKAVFAGKVGKEAIFTGGFDSLFMQLLNALPQKNDDAILGALVDAFEANGIQILKQTDYLRELLVKPGNIVGELTAAEYQDVKLGFRMAKASGDLDIGQTVVVKNGVVLAVEAIEGTDRAIVRGGELGGPGSVVVKVSKPRQDERFDVPTVGRVTLESMLKAKAAILAVEAEKTLLTERDFVLELAERNGIKIVAVSSDVLAN